MAWDDSSFGKGLYREMLEGRTSGWEGFTKQHLAGVPHAVDIAFHLSSCQLTYPGMVGNDRNCELAEVDLPFYCIVHNAYRKGILRRFLLLMERLKLHPQWFHLRSCRNAQQIVLDQFLLQWKCDDEECFQLLSSWLTTRIDREEFEGDVCIKRAA